MLLLGPSDVLLTQVEPIRQNYWSLSLMGPSGIGTLPALEGLALRDLPSLGTEQEAISHKPINNTIKYPGGQQSQSSQLRFMMFDTDPVYSFFARWRRLCYNPETHLAGLLGDVAGTGLVRIYTPSSADDFPQVVREIRLESVWPSSLIISGLQRDGDEPLGYEVMLEIGNSYDANP